MVMRYIPGPPASGKTTKALQQLADEGGGIFITPYSREVMMLAGKVGLSNSSVKILELNKGTRIVIDGDDDYEITVTRRTRD